MRGGEALSRERTRHYTVVKESRLLGNIGLCWPAASRLPTASPFFFAHSPSPCHPHNWCGCCLVYGGAGGLQASLPGSQGSTQQRLRSQCRRYSTAQRALPASSCCRPAEAEAPHMGPDPPAPPPPVPA